MITSVGKLSIVKSGSSTKKTGTVSFSAARYMTMLSAAEKRGSVNAVKRNLEREAQKIKNSGADSAQVKRALQKIKYVMGKADEKIVSLTREERKKARMKRAEDTGKKEEAKKMKKRLNVEKYFRKSNEHGNIVRTALQEKDELNKKDFSDCTAGGEASTVQTAESTALSAGAVIPESAVTGMSSVDIMI